MIQLETKSGLDENGRWAQRQIYQLLLELAGEAEQGEDLGECIAQPHGGKCYDILK